MARSTSSSAATTSQATRTRRGPDRVDRGLAVPGHTRLGSRVLDGSGPTNAPVQRRAVARSPQASDGCAVTHGRNPRSDQSKAGRRTIGVPAPLAALLHKHRAEQNAERAGARVGGSLGLVPAQRLQLRRRHLAHRGRDAVCAWARTGWRSAAFRSSPTTSHSAMSFAP